MPSDITTITFNADELKVQNPTTNTGVSNKQYIDNKLGELSGALIFKGTLDASGSASQLANAKVGWLWVVSVAGTILSQELKVGDEVYCKTAVTGTPTDFSSFEIIPGEQGILRTTDVVNNLTSTVTDKPLSANMGKNLEDNKAPVNNPTFTGTVSGINKTMVGLGNVDNTSDDNKPVSTATQSALNLKVNISDKANGQDIDTGTNDSKYVTSKAIEDSLVLKNTYNILDDFPVEKPTIAIYPGESRCTIDENRKVSSLELEEGGVSLTQSTLTKQPTLKTDKDRGITYLNFDSDIMGSDGISANLIGGSSGNTTSFLFVARSFNASQDKTNFSWIEGQSPTYDNTNRLQTFLPWSDGILYNYFRSNTGGALEISGQNGTVDGIEKYIAVRNGTNATFYRDGNSIGTSSSLTANFTSTDTGRITIGGQPITDTNYANMDFYLLLITNVAWSLSDVAKITEWVNKKYG